ncbi:MAG: hypothetical protein ACI7YS_16215 [Flavobacterium sp.]
MIGNNKQNPKNYNRQDYKRLILELNGEFYTFMILTANFIIIQLTLSLIFSFYQTLITFLGVEIDSIFSIPHIYLLIKIENISNYPTLNLILSSFYVTTILIIFCFLTFKLMKNNEFILIGMKLILLTLAYVLLHSVLYNFIFFTIQYKYTFDITIFEYLTENLHFLGEQLLFCFSMDFITPIEFIKKLIFNISELWQILPQTIFFYKNDFFFQNLYYNKAMFFSFLITMISIFVSIIHIIYKILILLYQLLIFPNLQLCFDIYKNNRVFLNRLCFYNPYCRLLKYTLLPLLKHIFIQTLPLLKSWINDVFFKDSLYNILKGTLYYYTLLTILYFILNLIYYY